VTHQDRFRGQDLSDEALRAASICPYLRAEGGSWRSARASREHRCTALAPPTVLALDKQRRLCLVAVHAGCPTYLAARSGHRDEPSLVEPSSESGPIPDRSVGLDRLDQGAVTRWRFTRPAPVVLDGSGGPPALSAVLRGRGVQGALVTLLLVAFAAIAVGRFSAPGGAAIPTSNPPASSAATQAPTAAVPTATPSPEPTAAATPVPTATPTPSPTPAPSVATYVVQSGDTLSGIAARFGTTVAILQELNGIANPSKIRVGLVLILP
jgi:LysM repeat protein